MAAFRALSASLLTFAALVRYNGLGGDSLNSSNLYRIQNTAVGFRTALADLVSDDGDRKMAEAMQQLHEHDTRRLSSREVGYLAAMFIAWQDRGSPEIWA